MSIKTDNGNYCRLVGHIIGPKESPYVGGKFRFTLDIPRQYPFKPPIFKLTTKIYHCNFMGEGLTQFIERTWCPALHIVNLL